MTERLPSQKTMIEAAKKAIEEDRPILLDYWAGSLDKTVMIGINEIEGEQKEKLLVRNPTEYTSPIVSIFRVKTGIEATVNGKKEELIEYIIMTEHSLYLVDSKIPINNISSSN
jgi:hypothetical protein